MKSFIIIFILLSNLALSQTVSKTNAIILEFAEANLGKKLGDGVCRSFTNQAIYEAKKKVYGKAKYKDYVTNIGAPKINNYKDALPGDIIAFREIWLDNRDSTYGYISKHIGILKYMDEEKIVYYNQNDIKEGETTRKDSKVVITTLYIKYIVSGDISFHRSY